MKETKQFELELGGQTYRPALDLNAILCIQRETGNSHEALLERVFSAETRMWDRVDALRVLVWAMIYTDCAKRLRVPQPHLADVGIWFEQDHAAIAKQLGKLFGAASGQGAQEGSLAPFVPTPTPVVRKMIELADIQPKEHVVDLGAGDGRLLFAAVDAAAGVTATGYETHPERYEALRKACEDHQGAAVVPADIRTAALGDADVVFLYLLPSSNAELKPKLLKEMKPGARVVSHDFAMPDWEFEQMESVKADGRNHTVYQWRIPG